MVGVGLALMVSEHFTFHIQNPTFDKLVPKRSRRLRMIQDRTTYDDDEKPGNLCCADHGVVG
jgi:hypothetical protein